ncbi:GumC family protein [Candidatus Omnitrophota bacterium]
MEQQNPFLEQEIDLREYVRVLYERRWVIISITVILCTLSLIRSFMMKPVYQATTRVLIQREAPHVVNIQGVNPTEYREREYYQTQYAILKSRSIAERVSKALGGYVPWNEWDGRKDQSEGKMPANEELARALLGRVDIKPIMNTQIVEIKVKDVDPKLSARIANLWSENYISYVLDTKFDATQYASGYLETKIKEAKQGVENAETRLQEYRKQYNIIATSEERGPTVLDVLLKRRTELAISLSEKLEYYKEKHPEIIGIRSELASVEKKIASEQNEELQAKDTEMKYNMLERETETSRKMYDSLLSRIKETEVTGELRTTNIRIIDKATVPKSPVSPKKKRNLLIALMIGIFGGSGLAFFVESLDQSVKTPEDLKNRVKMPALASIAVPDEDDERGVSPEFITSVKPHSTISEAYRGLRTSIMFTAVEHKRKMLLFTSSGPQEGKTTSAINLAIVMAQSGEKTILLDADLRQPRVEKAFNLDIEHGVTEVLAGKENLDSVIHNTDIQDLDIITCGAIPPNPSELLGSKKMSGLLAQLEERYDRIIIDTPPVLAVTDAVVLSGKVDGTIIVVKAGETNRNAVIKTKEIIESVQSSNLIGAVLNMVETGKTGGHYYYYHYYGKKYGHYGQEKKEQTSASKT